MARLLTLVKYCGGCNSRHDRTAFAARLAGEFPGVEFVSAATNREAPDVVLVVCGCPSRCAAHAELTGGYGKAVAASPEDYAEARATVRRALAYKERTGWTGEASTDRKS